MANTTNLNMTKLAGTEKQKTFPSTFNGNMDAIDGAFGAGFGVSGKPTVNAEINSIADGLAIISNNNTHAAITAGQFVYVRGHGSLSDGLYVATSNIAANGTLSGSNLTADSSGGLNSVYASLNSKIATEEEQTFTGDFSTVTLRRRANVIYCNISSLSSLDADWQTIGTTQFYNPNRTLMGSLVSNAGKIIKLRITNTGSFQAFAVGGAINSNVYIQDTAIIN